MKIISSFQYKAGANYICFFFIKGRDFKANASWVTKFLDDNNIVYSNFTSRIPDTGAYRTSYTEIQFNSPTRIEKYMDSLYKEAKKLGKRIFTPESKIQKDDELGLKDKLPKIEKIMVDNISKQTAKYFKDITISSILDKYSFDEVHFFISGLYADEGFHAESDEIIAKINFKELKNAITSKTGLEIKRVYRSREHRDIIIKFATN